MKNPSRKAVLGSLLLLSIYLYLVAEVPFREIILRDEPIVDRVREEQKALEYLNYLRVNSGLIPLRENLNLKIAARNHAEYLTKNCTIGHSEDSNMKGFTGLYGSNRAIYAGYRTSMVIENISSNNFNHRESIDGLMSAIYHRFGFLDFHIDEIGIGVSQNIKDRYNTAFVYDMGSRNLENLCKDAISNGKETMDSYVIGICADRNLKIDGDRFIRALNLNGNKNSKIVIYPFDGQDDIPPAFYDELPDPLPEYSVSGFPISISFNSNYFEEVELIDFRLFKGDDEITERVIYSKESDPNGRLEKWRSLGLISH